MHPHVFAGAILVSKPYTARLIHPEIFSIRIHVSRDL